MSNIKSKEPPTAPATKQLNNIPEIEPRMGSLYRGSEYFQDIEFIFNTYGNFEYIKEQAYKKNTQERIHYLKTILSKYTDLEKEITSKYNHSLEEFEGYYKNLIQYCYFDDEIMSWDEEDRNKFIGMILDNTKKYSTLFNTFWRTLKSISLLIDAESPAIKKGEIKSLIEKINWQAGEDVLRTHLEKLRDKKFIQYDNIDSVMSGEEIAVFKKTLFDVAGLFHFWSNAGFIEGYFIKTIKQDTNTTKILKSHSMIINSFYYEEKGKNFEADSLKANATKTERLSKIESKEKVIESVLL